MPTVKIPDGDIQPALRECRRMFVETKRDKSKYLYFMKSALKKREKLKRAAMKRKYYKTLINQQNPNSPAPAVASNSGVIK